MIKIFTCILLSVLLLGTTNAQEATVSKKHDPKMDANLSPNFNPRINPEKNSILHPKFNWNLNPHKNKLICPEKVDAINPLKNTELNPLDKTDMNPMFVTNLSPKFITWKGQYLFDKEDNHIGYITYINQNLIAEFDKTATWKFFYVKTAKGTYNQFDLEGKWTGYYICSDEMAGFNLFDAKDEWTGMHIK
jgi:hypothetical protein